MSLSGMLDCSASAYKPAVAIDSAGGQTQDFTPGDTGVVTLFTGLACSYQPVKGNVQLMYAQRDQVCDGTLYFVQDPGDLVNALVVLSRLRIGDTIQLNSLGTGDPIQMGQTWVWPVDCTRVRQPS
ncbi:MAG: hypothetical protein KGL39_25720 [Patescibacteria group bacterium]|nr:hypothetical protein [Patescibacteria group bacterium]